MLDKIGFAVNDLKTTSAIDIGDLKELVSMRRLGFGVQMAVDAYALAQIHGLIKFDASHALLLWQEKPAIMKYSFPSLYTIFGKKASPISERSSVTAGGIEKNTNARRQYSRGKCA
jgi:hypothetical protein